MSKYNFEQKRNDYLTPPELVKMGLEMAGAEKFDCDVCCSIKNIPADFHYIEGETDGLTQYWHKLNWCNPPYDECDKWVKRAAEEAVLEDNSTVMLIPARPETKYWHDYILDLNGGCNRFGVKVKFLRKGYCFINPDTNKRMGVYKNPLALVFFRGIVPFGEDEI